MIASQTLNSRLDYLIDVLVGTLQGIAEMVEECGAVEVRRSTHAECSSGDQIQQGQSQSARPVSQKSRDKDGAPAAQGTDYEASAWGTAKFGMGRPANKCRHGFASNRTQRWERDTRALSVAIPVSAYIWR
jgi:hypothetical protein